MALSAFLRGACKKGAFGWIPVANLGPPDSNPSRRDWVGLKRRNITNSWTADTKTRVSMQNISSPSRTADQTPIHCVNTFLTFASLEINETCGDCDMGAHIWVSSFCSLMWKPYLYLPERSVGNDRSDAVPKNPHRKKERPK